jgi:hypothetical protein
MSREVFGHVQDRRSRAHSPTFLLGRFLEAQMASRRSLVHCLFKLIVPHDSDAETVREDLSGKKCSIGHPCKT